MQILRPHPRPTESETWGWKGGQWSQLALDHRSHRGNSYATDIGYKSVLLLHPHPMPTLESLWLNIYQPTPAQKSVFEDVLQVFLKHANI